MAHGLRHVEIVTAPGEALNFTHTGTVALTRSGEFTSETLVFRFPDLVSDGSTAIDVRVELLTSGGSSGAVNLGALQLASISGHELVFTWEGDCAL